MKEVSFYELSQHAPARVMPRPAGRWGVVDNGDGTYTLRRADCPHTLRLMPADLTDVTPALAQGRGKPRGDLLGTEYQVVGQTMAGHTLVEISPEHWGEWTHTAIVRQAGLRAHKIGRPQKGTIILELSAAELAALTTTEVNDDDE